VVSGLAASHLVLPLLRRQPLSYDMGAPSTKTRRSGLGLELSANYSISASASSALTTAVLASFSGLEGRTEQLLFLAAGTNLLPTLSRDVKLAVLAESRK